MKKFLLFMLMMIGMVTGVTLITSCGNHRAQHSYFNKRDSVEIAKIAKSVIVDNASAVEFDDPQEFLVYVVHNRDKYSAEQVIFNLHDNVLSGIAYALSSSHQPISIYSVADEYAKRKSFYDGVSQGMPPAQIESFQCMIVIYIFSYHP